MQVQSMQRPVEVFRHWQAEGWLCLNAPYQRGDVWGEKRQVNLIYSLLVGIPIPAIIINDRMEADSTTGSIAYAIIDGKQRVTAILKFMGGQLAVPGEWFGLEKPTVVWSDIPLVEQRMFKNRCIPTCEGRLKTLADEQHVFDLVNFGGLAQGESDV